MKIFIDTENEFKCYTANKNDNLLEFEDEFFDDKCTEFVEGYCCKPAGYELNGEYTDVKMIYPWKDSKELDRMQLEYEVELLKAENADMKDALGMFGVKVDE